ncbi:YceI family protein [Asticcacaulis excentricus]|uniref:YceI family protein n=1 Tax=Asticcacaulis excentricus (strain ATCC 15261 / DSM 4724 / KCTC 12464 / NCIMB 9791 / VKM B-1370 / CB 48) TaxID=573065 RepID=E8RKJ3_ASTEC|nr:YceI family protein [Asticcacaulis excentricus]ADU12473.1 YceI family protein [Asticcacaulis excentricus CB 48]
MRHVFKSTFIAAALFAGSLTPAFAAPETYALEATHTEVVFSWTHFGFSKPTAKFMNAVGTLVLDEAAPATSSVEVTFAIDGLNTGVAALDGHLKSKDFFDAATYPTATFKSTKVDVTGKDTANVTGNLTIHGVTKPVTLAVKLNKIGANMKGVKTAGFSATGQIKRSDFGMGAYVPAVSDEIDLVITAEANKK